MSSTPIALIQAAGDYEAIRRHTSEDFLPLAMTPFAVDALRALSVNYQYPGEFKSNLSSQDHVQDIKDYARWCLKLDAKADGFFGTPGKTPRLFLNYMSILRNYIFLFLRELDKLLLILERTSAKTIYYCEYAGEFAALSRVINLFGESKKSSLKIVPVPHSNTLALTFNPENVIPWQIFTGNPLRNILKFLLGRSPEKSFVKTAKSWLRWPLPGSNILVLDVLCEASEYQKIAGNKEVNILYWSDLAFENRYTKKLPQEKCQLFLDLISADPEISGWPRRQDICLFPLLLPLLEQTVQKLPLLRDTITHFKKLHKRYGFRTVITPFEIPQAGAVFDYCDAHGIRTDLLLHGGTVGLIADMPPAPVGFRGTGGESQGHYLVYSEAIKTECEKIKKDCDTLQVQTVLVRPPYFEYLGFKNREHSPAPDTKTRVRVCYVLWSIGSFAVNYRAGIYDDTSLYCLRQEVVDLFSLSQKSTLLIKFGYGMENLDLRLHRQVLSHPTENIKACGSETRFSAMVADYDLFILEFPSTPLLEIVPLNKPVIMLAEEQTIRITQESTRLLEGRAQITTHKDHFIGALRDVSENGFEAHVFQTFKQAGKNLFSEYFIGMNPDSRSLSGHIYEIHKNAVFTAREPQGESQLIST